jgi:hypothetical protein
MERNGWPARQDGTAQAADAVHSPSSFFLFFAFVKALQSSRFRASSIGPSIGRAIRQALNSEM